jgi:hypothetical protein
MSLVYLNDTIQNIMIHDTKYDSTSMLKIDEFVNGGGDY